MASDTSSIASDSSSIHHEYMRECIKLSLNAPAKPTNFRVGALLVAEPSHTILATGYTLELPGNTHAEQSALAKYAQQKGVDDPEHRLADAFPPPPPGSTDTKLAIYTSMEPCALRLSGNKTCAQRILDTRAQGWGVTKVYYGLKEPETFVGESAGVKMLTDAGIELEYVAGLEEEILTVTLAGHAHK
ncbi:Hypothetical protein R9X50_00274700 [Acrodontium crateriforme]|uniref:CMP/dCMP-type deaminase domain-containing protein n=1 Tax=Acrodontium crateriforme TaxID=150365 RepID=A0AAQ3R9B1_9PEZI|nr:Hypothetical protein R9X50_00274700 [Acrodontium crateriforme]